MFCSSRLSISLAYVRTRTLYIRIGRAAESAHRPRGGRVSRNARALRGAAPAELSAAAAAAAAVDPRASGRGREGVQEARGPAGGSGGGAEGARRVCGGGPEERSGGRVAQDVRLARRDAQQAVRAAGPPRLIESLESLD